SSRHPPTLRSLHSFPTRRSSDLLAPLLLNGLRVLLELLFRPRRRKRRARSDQIPPLERRGIEQRRHVGLPRLDAIGRGQIGDIRSEEHTSELQSRFDIVCRLLLE